MQLGEQADLTGRILSALASVTGVFRRRLPAHELTSAEFLKVFVPGRFESLHDFLAHHAARPLTWKEIPPALVTDGMIEAANRAAAQEFSFLGSSFTFSGTVDWHHSLGPGGPWPRAHWSEIQFRNVAHLGDIKPCWEMNRHQFFVPLAFAFIATGDAKYAQAVKRFLHSWCDQNTPEMGVNYISGIDIGLRCLSWLFADRLLRGSADWDEATQERMHRNIYAQARHISEYLSFDGHGSRSHNLLGEAASLAWIALQYPEWRESEGWLKRALVVLWPALDAQVFPDGIHFEASCGYQLQVVELLALVFTEMRRQKKPLPSKSYLILEKMTAALRALQQPDGELPNINDNDDGVVIPLPLSTAERLEGLMTVMAVLYDRPDFKSSAAKTFPLYALMLLGDAGREEFRMIAEYPKHFAFLNEFRNGGLHVLRRNADWLLLKNNPDPFPQSGHNHADLLSVLLFIDGTPILADAGTYRFNDDRGLRNALRGTAAHNTIVVDKEGQAEPLRNFDWSRTVKPGFTQVHDEDAFAVIDAQHDSFHDRHVTHRRVVIWFKADDNILIIDQMQGVGAHTFTQNWHFPPGMRIEEKGAQVYKLGSAATQAGFLRLLRTKNNEEAEVIAGSDRTPEFFYSLHYGAIEPGVAIRHTWTSSLDAGHSSHRIALFSKTDAPPEFGDVWHAEFLFNGWDLNLSHAPAKITRSKV